MSRETCFCGLNTLDTEVIDYCVMGEPCCTRKCYSEALEAAKPLEVDGYWFSEPKSVSGAAQ